MDAFILAAGLGTRLRPLTDRIPKALVPVAGVSMLERTARRLIAAGANRLIVNVHHHPEQIIQCLQDRGGFGAPWVVSYEADRPLDTGGALLHARELIRREEPFYLHNVDVLTDFPLPPMYEAHLASGAAATVAVSDRASRRGLIFGPHGLCGRYDGEQEWRVAPMDGGAPGPPPASGGGSAAGRPPASAGGSAAGAPAGSGSATLPAPVTGRFPFAGVHVISPRVLDRITETGAFSVLDLYLRLVSEGELVAGYRIDGSSWFDIGSPEKLAAADAALSVAKSEPD